MIGDRVLQLELCSAASRATASSQTVDPCRACRPREAVRAVRVMRPVREGGGGGRHRVSEWAVQRIVLPIPNDTLHTRLADTVTCNGIVTRNGAATRYVGRYTVDAAGGGRRGERYVAGTALAGQRAGTALAGQRQQQRKVLTTTAEPGVHLLGDARQSLLGNSFILLVVLSRPYAQSSARLTTEGRSTNPGLRWLVLRGQPWYKKGSRAFAMTQETRAALSDESQGVGPGAPSCKFSP